MTTEPEPIGSKLVPSALDAYVSAEPDEPVFTLQGGDPLAPPLVIMWARLARARCGLGFEPEATLDNIARIIRENQVETENEANDLLKRATEAEQVSWSMSAYAKGQLTLDLEADIKPVELRLDLHDYRIYCANRLANAFSEMTDMIEQLGKLGYDDEDTIASIKNEVLALRLLFNAVEPRPGRRLSNAFKW